MGLRFFNLMLLGVFLLGGNTLFGMRAESAHKHVPTDQPFEESEEESKLEIEQVDSLIVAYWADPIVTNSTIVVARAIDEFSLAREPITHGPNCSRAPPRN